ncbi:MAG TPA: Ig domain-containing protein [Acidimicrobiales bacterium]|nr:Ig domain-containing protein [Acidimicrobiales bacterium]
MNLSVEENPIIPSLSGVSVSSFFASLTLQTYAADQQQEAQIIINDLQPQYLDLIDEVSTFSNSLGMTLTTTSTLTQLLDLEITGLTKSTTKIGAGIGTWESYALEQAIAGIAGIDYLSIHVYPIGQSQIAVLNAITTIAANAHLPLNMDETWLNKDWLSGPPSSTSTADEQKIQTFSFWEPIDSQFLSAIVQYARSHGFELISGFGSDNFFSYVTWTSAIDAESDNQVSNLETQQVAAALPSGAITSVGNTYLSLASSPTPPALTLNNASLPIASVGTAYSADLGASGGIPPYNWSVSSGLLPSGISLSSYGSLAGTSSTPGSYAISVAVADSEVPPATTIGTITFTVAQPTSNTSGYWMLGSTGTVYPFGNAAQYGPTGSINGQAVALAADPGGAGYWIVNSSGLQYAFGNAPSLQLSAPTTSPAVSIASTGDGQGTWVATSGGQVLTSGDAVDYGSPAENAIKLAAPIVNMAINPDGKGYWLLGADGGVFTFGDASFFGSTGNIHLNKPAVAMFPTSDGKGYWFVASDGGIFAFGDAGYFGSMGANTLNRPVDGIVATSDGLGYWMVASDGGVFAFGDAGFVGSLGGRTIPDPIVGFAAT